MRARCGACMAEGGVALLGRQGDRQGGRHVRDVHEGTTLAKKCISSCMCLLMMRATGAQAQEDRTILAHWKPLCQAL